LSKYEPHPLDKDRVFGEAFPELKPGGRFAVSDVVTKGDVPAEMCKRGRGILRQ